ncbi:YjfB family protein [Paenibacillus sp. FSL R10-2734]|uniref:YjfB family protein n=1 Tax=Paenibacillus sp. FSL R10-2734 TaxID=2954691 RepID=UPI0030D76DBA
MDIAALSMAMSQASLAQNVGIQVMSIAKNQAETQSQIMVEMLGKSVAPNLGKTLDISV